MTALFVGASFACGLWLVAWLTLPFGYVESVAKRAGMVHKRDGAYAKFVGGFEASLVARSKESFTFSLRYDLRPLITSEVDCSPKSLLFGTKPRTGFSAFDDAFSFRGPEALALAFFVPHAAQLESLLRRHGASIEKGKLVMQLSGVLTLARLEDALRTLEAVGLTLRSDGAQVPERLLSIVIAERFPIAGRVRCLDHLVRSYRSSEPTERALAFAKGALEPQLQARAAALSSDVTRIAEITRDETFPILLRRDMLGAHEQSAKPWEHRDLLRELVASPLEGLALAAIWGLARANDRASVPRLLSLLPSAKGEKRKAMLQALAKLASPEHERLVHGAVAHFEPDERVIAVRMLGSIGSVESVAALIALRERAGLMASTMKREIDLAITLIQSRLHGAEAGQVSVIDDEQHGALSLSAEPGAAARRHS